MTPTWVAVQSIGGWALKERCLYQHLPLGFQKGRQNFEFVLKYFF